MKNKHKRILLYILIAVCLLSVPVIVKEHIIPNEYVQIARGNIEDNKKQSSDCINSENDITTIKIVDKLQSNIVSDTDFEVVSIPDDIELEIESEISDLDCVEETDDTECISTIDNNKDNLFYGSTDELIYLGEFFATAYTHTGNNTATGVYPKANHTVGVDPDIIPYGTTIVVEVMGELRTYVAEDTGYLDEYQLDIFYDTYDECVEFGVRDCKVWVLK